MTRKNFKIALLASMIVTILVPFSTMGMASASTNETTNITTDKNADYFKRHGFSEEFVKKMREKYEPYQKLGLEASTYYTELKTLGDSLEDQARKAELKEKIRVLEAQKNKIIPDGKIVHIPEPLFKKMNEAKDRIFYSGLPWFELYVSTSTGKLTVVIDKEKTLDIDDKIIKLAGKDIPLDIKYHKNMMELQSSCESSARGYCDPVSGRFITDDANGLPWTIGLAFLGGGATLFYIRRRKWLAVDHWFGSSTRS